MISPYAQELFDSGRGELLLRRFFRKIILLHGGKSIPKGTTITRKNWNEWREAE